MSEISERYRRNVAAFAAKVDAVPDDQWSAATPCDEWTARDVVRHVVDTQGMFLGFVGREAGEIPSVDDDPAGALVAATGAVQAGLDDPERAAETFTGMMGEQTFEQAVDRFLSVDLVIHGWDLAWATGQDEAMDPAEVERVQAAMGSLPEEAMRSPGAFGPAIEPEPGAGEQDRLLAFLGRQP